ncbi:protein PYRICULARIA ORYZAE RESISTANCE 21 [Amborella trichopoda]|uniref:HMA domain-containing protein n=1 Tax=Amborella trichopoda TaxID=13333 RepID=W1PTE0_AMBTC|nr:protein PYRICULARIA ORYZAE RESISTANCE 21 [Amborella trichopoda]ERN10555.1 hypothetical protein AMTR_s00028p00037280 [Amborella trichopoda]|eukprot:XP_006848974.1 protein PYRICULARIA ORYZAE RESISTANCE 21 [Amborella trichopoda]
MAEKVYIVVIKAKLDCPRCYKKLKKALCCIPEIQSQTVDEKKNTVTITGPFEPNCVKCQLCRKAGKAIISIDIKEKGDKKQDPGPAKKTEEPKADGKPPNGEKKPVEKETKPVEKETKPVDDAGKSSGKGDRGGDKPVILAPQTPVPQPVLIPVPYPVPYGTACKGQCGCGGWVYCEPARAPFCDGPCGGRGYCENYSFFSDHDPYCRIM